MPFLLRLRLRYGTRLRLRVEANCFLYRTGITANSCSIKRKRRSCYASPLVDTSLPGDLPVLAATAAGMSATTARVTTTAAGCMSAATGCVTTTTTTRRGYCMSATSTRGYRRVTATTARHGCMSATAASIGCAATSTSTTAHIASTATAAKAMSAPAVTIAPVGPWTYAQEDAVVKIARAEVAGRRAGVGCVVVVAVRTYRRRTANPDYELCLSGRHEGQGGEQC